MKLRILIIGALGLAVTVYLVTYAGFGAVLKAAAAVGWGGFALLCLYGLALFPILGLGWYVLVPAGMRTSLAVFIWARLVRDAGSEVLPVSQLGGMALGARTAILHGMDAPLSAASMIVDVTTEMLGQMGYIAIGVLILSAQAAHDPFARSLTATFVTGFVVAAIAGGIFLAMQRYGHYWIATRVAGKLFPRALAVGTAVAAGLDTIYGSRARFALSLALHFCGWVMSGVGTWIAFRLMGERVDLAPVLAIESLVYAARSAAFVVPNALGVQEAAYALLAPVLGVGREFGLAVSLIKRARDLVIGVPVLLAWQAVESQRALRSPAVVLADEDPDSPGLRAPGECKHRYER